MRSGRLDRRIDIQRAIMTQDASGQEVQTWETIVRRRAATVFPIRGDERFSAEQFVAKQQCDFQIRYSASLADLNPEDRILYPAQGDESPTPAPEVHTIFDIIEVSEIGRREGLKISAVRRSEIVT